MFDWVENYPWTKVTSNNVEPWRQIGSSWMDFIEREMPGWFGITAGMCAAVQGVIDAHPGSSVEIMQFKEKYGSARLYFTSTEDIFAEVDDIIHAYELKSATTCIKCGKEGKKRYDSWIVTLCDDCNENSVIKHSFPEY